MKIKFYLPLVTSVLLITNSFVFCSKNDSSSSTIDPTTSASISTVSSDATQTSNDVEDASNDVNNVIETNSITGSTIAARYSIRYNASLPGSTVSFSGTGLNMVITFTFDGTTAVNGYIRGGKIAVSTNGANFRTAGAVLTQTFTNFTVKNVSTGKTTTYSGTRSITNISGGLLKDFSISSSISTPSSGIVYGIRGNHTVTFDDGTQRTFFSKCKVTYSLVSDTLQASLSADTTLTTSNSASTGLDSVCQYGTTRYGQFYFTRITAPIVSNAKCGWRKPTSGSRRNIVYTSASDASSTNVVAPTTANTIASVKLTEGVDATGRPVVQPSNSITCPYGRSYSETKSKTGETSESTEKDDD